MEISELMKKFTDVVGIDAIEPDDNGAYHFEIDGMVVSFAERKDTRELLTVAEVGEPPPDGRELLYRTLLESAFLGEGTDGAAFSIERGSGQVCLHRADPLDLMDLDRFRGMLERFVNVLENWRRLVADFRETAPGQAKSAAEDARAVRQSREDGFIRV